MKVQNISKYRAIIVKGVKIGPKEIKDIPGLGLVEVMSTDLRTKLIIVEEASKRAAPKTVRKVSKPREKVEPKEPKEEPEEMTHTETDVDYSACSSTHSNSGGGVVTSSDTRGSPIGSKDKEEKSEKE